MGSMLLPSTWPSNWGHPKPSLPPSSDVGAFTLSLVSEVLWCCWPTRGCDLPLLRMRATFYGVCCCGEFPMTEVREGGCLCGALRYRVNGKPQRVTACHCTFCQRRTGGALSIHAWFHEKELDLSGTGVATYEHRSDESNHWLRLHFCSRCATTIMLTLEKYPELRLITGGTLDDPNSIVIDTHVWAKSAPPWMTFPPNVSCFDTSSSAGIIR